MHEQAQCGPMIFTCPSGQLFVDIEDVAGFISATYNRERGPFGTPCPVVKIETHAGVGYPINLDSVERIRNRLLNRPLSWELVDLGLDARHALFNIGDIPAFASG